MSYSDWVSMPLSEQGLALLLLVLFGAFPTWVLSYILHFFVALAAQPDLRAKWTVGPSFLVGVVALTFGGPPFGVWLPLAAIPGALLAYLYWRHAFRKAWIDNPDDHPDVKLANDNWRVGLALVVGAIVVGVLRRLWLIL